ncbi:MAG: biotin synthase BioB [Nannocystaceae bacterium]|nr:biotin synthase BioB [Myxococcales bacterium]
MTTPESPARSHRDPAADTGPLPAPAELARRILAGDDAALDMPTLTRFLAGEGDVWELMAAADTLRRARFGDRVHLCSIVNAKQGGCPEDCGFCSQSRHFSTGVSRERFLPADAMVAASEKARRQGATALGLVTATRGLDDDGKALEHMIAGVRAVRDAGHTEAHASLGFLSRDALVRLKDAGLTELNHNLETGRGYFSKIVTTHTYDERIATIRAAKELGLRTCVGGIFGMGEAPVHRAELALELRALDVDEVPLNFLVSIEGTRLERVDPLAPLEILRIIACFRLALPRQNIFIAAGRTHLGQLMPLMFSAGASGMMVGDFLTTANRTVDDDLELLAQLGLVGLGCGEARPELRAAPTRGATQQSPARLPVVA